jgi:hypothetical protein
VDAEFLTVGCSWYSGSSVGSEEREAAAKEEEKEEDGRVLPRA